MLLVISPAKTLDYSNPEYSSHTQPDFPGEVKDLVGVLRKKSASEISKLMHLSDSLASLNEERYKTFRETFSPENSKQALLAFKGEVYAKMEADQFSAADLEFAQQHLRILSGLYGILNPNDLVAPYRLEMKTKLPVKKAENLYQFWGDKVAKQLRKDTDYLVNLASDEYSKVVLPFWDKDKVITPVFMEENEGKPKVVMMYAKNARGKMARFIIEQGIENLSDMQGFDLDGYRFETERSIENRLVFLR